jgi:hypothetical protein
MANLTECPVKPRPVSLETLHAELLACATAYLRTYRPEALDEKLSSTEVFDRAMALGWRDDPEWFRWTDKGFPIIRIPEWARKAKQN